MDDPIGGDVKSARCHATGPQVLYCVSHTGRRDEAHVLAGRCVAIDLFGKFCAAGSWRALYHLAASFFV